MLIRPEQISDYSKIYQLIKTAFETAAVKDGTEQDYVDKLRNSENYIPDLALIAEDNGLPIGHIMLTKILLGSDTSVSEQLLLSPLCVALPYRDQCIGKSLIQESFQLAKSRGYTTIFLCGDPAYYSKFGFKPASDFGIINTSDIPQQYVLACELTESTLSNMNYTIHIT